MSLHRVLFTGGSLTEAERNHLLATGLDVELAPDNLTEEQLAAALADKDAYILGGVERASAPSFVNAKQLKVISFFGVGYSGFIDTEAATRQGIAVTNAPGANARAVAEFSVALMLDGWRGVTHLANTTKAGRWSPRAGRNIEGKTIGIIGMGTIGSIVATIAARGLGMRVVYSSRSDKPDLERTVGAVRLSLEELLAQSDVISLHVAYTPETDKLLSAQQLSAIKAGAILVNMGEAELIDPVALRAAIDGNRLAAVVMDGYYVEPVPAPAEDPYNLLDLPDDRFLVTPHTANATEESLQAMLATNVSSIRNILAGDDDRNIVNPTFRARK